MDVLAVFLSLGLALWALSEGRWIPLLVFNVVAVVLGWEYIPAVFTIMALLNVAAVWLLRRHAAPGHGPGLE